MYTYFNFEGRPKQNSIMNVNYILVKYPVLVYIHYSLHFVKLIY